MSAHFSPQFVNMAPMPQIFGAGSLWAGFLAEHCRVVWRATLVGTVLVCAVGPLRTSYAYADKSCVDAAEMVRKGVDLGDGSIKEQDFYVQAKNLCPKMAEAHFNLGLALQKSGKLAEAEVELRESLKLKDDSNFRVGLAGVLFQKGELSNAKVEYDKVLEKDGRHVQALQGLAVFFEKQREFEKALETLQKASAVDRSDFVTHFNLAALQEKMQRHDAAMEGYKRALEARPQHFETRYFLGMLQQRSGLLEDARRSLQAAAEIKPDDVRVHLALAEIFERLGDVTRSEVALRRVVSLSPQNLAAHVNLGLLLIETKQYQSAEEILQKAVAFDPRSSRAASALGWAELELGKFFESEKNLRSALTLDGTNAYAHNNLGVLLQRTGRPEEARAEFQAAARLAPDLLVAQKNFEAVSR